MAIQGLNLIRKTYGPEAFLKSLDLDAPRILNVGSSSVRFAGDTVNLDVVQKPGVDIVADAHDMPDIGTFDVVIANAMLQYCREPEQVAGQFLSVLRPGGYLYVDAPWVQPYCPDTPDLKRFSQDELKRIFRDFEVLECAPSITSGSAFAFVGYSVASRLTGNRYIDAGSRIVSSVLLWPFTFINSNAEHAAGGFYLTARKPG